MAKKRKATKKEDNTGLFIPAGLFIGLGFGAVYGGWAAGVLFGLGVGFLGMGIAKVWGKK